MAGWCISFGLNLPKFIVSYVVQVERCAHWCHRQTHYHTRRDQKRLPTCSINHEQCWYIADQLDCAHDNGSQVFVNGASYRTKRPLLLFTTVSLLSPIYQLVGIFPPWRRWQHRFRLLVESPTASDRSAVATIPDVWSTHCVVSLSQRQNQRIFPMEPLQCFQSDLFCKFRRWAVLAKPLIHQQHHDDSYCATKQEILARRIASNWKRL